MAGESQSQWWELAATPHVALAPAAGSSSRNWGGAITLKAYPSGLYHLARSCVPKFM